LCWRRPTATLPGRGLLAAGADARTSLTGQTALMTAARSGSVDSVTLLLDGGAEVNAVESWRGQSALMGRGGGPRRRRAVAHSSWGQHP
jgi:hypothetical protein